MTMVMVGGMDRLGKHYEAEAKAHGIDLRIFSQAEKGMAARLGSADAVILFTGKVSHRARREIMAAARKLDIPVHQLHSCGVCTLRECLDELCPIKARQER